MTEVEILPPRAAQAGPVPAAREGDLELLLARIHERVIRLGPGIVFNFKDLLAQAGLARAAGRALWTLVRGFEPEVLVGPGFGGVPLLYATALAALESDGVDLALWLVRDQRKANAGKPWIAGPRFDKPPRAVMIDDFLGRGSAVELIDHAAQVEGRELDLRAIGVLYDNWYWSGSRQLSVSRCPVVSVLRRHALGLSRDCHDAAPPLMKGAAPPFVGPALWSRLDFNGASDAPSKSSPVVAAGAVFAADDRSQVWRLDALTGEAVWCRKSQEMPEKGIVQRLRHADASVVYGCYDGTVTRLDDRRGEIVWRWKLDPHVHSTPEVDLARRRVFVNTESGDRAAPSGSLVALDWDSGRTLWRYRHAFWAPGSAAYDATANCVAATCNDHSLVCVDADAGTLRWQATTQGLVRGRPAIHDGCVIVCTETGWLQAFDLATGAELRSRRSGGGGKLHQFVHVADGLVYALDDNKHLAAFAVDDFRLAWISALRSPAAWAPQPWGRYLVTLSKKGELAVFDAERRLKLWEDRIEGRFAQSPALGSANQTPLFVCASHHHGLRAYQINPFYSNP